MRFGSVLCLKDHSFGSVQFGNCFSGSTWFGLRVSDSSWLGPVRFGSFPCPVPGDSRIKRFGSAGSVLFLIPSCLGHDRLSLCRESLFSAGAVSIFILLGRSFVASVGGMIRLEPLIELLNSSLSSLSCY